VQGVGGGGVSEIDRTLVTPRQKAFLDANPEVALSSEAPELEGRSEPSGIGGWLQFLIIALIFLGPLLNAVMTYVELQSAKDMEPPLSSDGFMLLQLISWSIFAAYCAISIGTGLLLQKRRKRSTIYIVVGLIWLLGPILNIGAAAIADAFDGSEGRSIVFSVVWTAYLLRSKRIKNTYIAE
jgi:hypothetical protein